MSSLRFLRIFQTHCVQRSTQLAGIYLKSGGSSTDNNHGALYSNNLHLQPFSGHSSLLNFARIFLPIKHLSSYSQIGWEQISFLQKDLVECVFKANLFISSLSKSCLVGGDVSVSGSMVAGSGKYLGLLPLANSMGFFATHSYLYVSHRCCLAH